MNLSFSQQGKRRNQEDAKTVDKEKEEVEERKEESRVLERPVKIEATWVTSLLECHQMQEVWSLLSSLLSSPSAEKLTSSAGSLLCRPCVMSFIDMMFFIPILQRRK